MGAEKEKRRVERKYLVFYLRIFEGLSFRVLGHVVNLSSRGLMVLSDRQIPLNKEYRLRMRLPKEMSDRPELIFNATSCWCKKDANPDFYLAGFEIQNLSMAERSDILHLLDEFSYSEE